MPPDRTPAWASGETIALDQAIAYANDRRQGKASDYTGSGMAPIVHHPDVQRNLLTMRALTHIARAISYSCAHAIDRARVAQGEAAANWRDRANLLTPLAKAFLAIGGAICSEDFAQGGRTLKTLGLGHLSKAELQMLLRKGF